MRQSAKDALHAGAAVPARALLESEPYAAQTHQIREGRQGYVFGRPAKASKVAPLAAVGSADAWTLVT